MSIYQGLATRLRKSAARSRALIIPHNRMRAWHPLVLALVIPVAGWAGEIQQRHPAKLLTIGDAIATAVEGNPGLAEMQARYEAMAEIPSQLGTLPDPVLSLNAINLPTDTFNLGQEAMTQMQIGISQVMPICMSIYQGLATRLRKSAARSRALIIPHNRMRAWHPLVLALVIPVAGWAGEIQQRHPAKLLTIGDAIATAVEGNPGLAEMQARYEAMAEIPSQLGTLPDPVLSLNAINLPTDTFNLGQEAMTQMQIGISQVMPFPGKLALRQVTSEYEALAAGNSVEEMRLSLISNTKSSWWQLYFLDRALDVVDSNQELLRQFIQVAQTKYKVGDGLQQDVLLAQLELSRLIDQKIKLKATRRNRGIQLNLLMDISPDNAVVLPKKVLAAMPDIIDENILYEQAEITRPLLKQKENDINAAQSRLELARKEYYPDFKLGVAYGNRSGDNPLPRGGTRSDFLSVMFSFNLPLYTKRKRDRAVSQRNLELRKSRNSLRDKKGVVRSEISSATTDYLRARELYELFESGIIPQARQTVSSMLAGYQVSEVDFLNLVRSQVTLLNYEVQYWKALTEANQALARLVAAVSDFKLGVAYGNRSGDNPLPRGGTRSDFLSVMFSFNLPLYTKRKRDRAVSQRNLELRKSRNSLRDKKGVVRSEISSATTDYLRARELYELFESGIIPQARQTVSSMLAGYQVSEVDFLNLVRSQVTLLNYEVQYWKALTEANQALARLVAAVGEEKIYE